MEESERRRIEDAKEHERHHAMEDLETWKTSQTQQRRPPPHSSAPARSRVVGIETLDADADSDSTDRTAASSAVTRNSSSPEIASPGTAATAAAPEKKGTALRRAAEAVAAPPAAQDAKAIFAETSSAVVSSMSASASKDALQKKPKEKVVPPVRAAARIEMSFTPRVFPTPSRESQAPQEEEVKAGYYLVFFLIDSLPCRIFLLIITL